MLSRRRAECRPGRTGLCRVARTVVFLARWSARIASEATAVASAPSSAVLAATKIQIPEARSGLVRRTRLIEFLGASAHAKLALIQAPVGSGKTTLLADWHAAASETRPFAWLSLDRGDNDPVRFLDGVIAALRTVATGFARSCPATSAPPPWRW